MMRFNDWMKENAPGQPPHVEALLRKLWIYMRGAKLEELEELKPEPEKEEEKPDVELADDERQEEKEKGKRWRRKTS